MSFKIKQMNSQRICLVCGDQATAFNFGGLSCGSCKIFFYRNSSLDQELKCQFTGNCQITTSTRKCCPKCRLRRCFDIGMELRCVEKRDLKQTAQLTKEVNLRNLLQTDMMVEEGESGSPQYKQTRLAKVQFVDLTTCEWKRLNELQSAMEIFPDEDTLPVIGHAQSLSEGYSYYGLYARRIIKFCKHFSAYKSLSRDDQLTVLKQFYFEFFAIRAAYQHSDNTNQIALIENEAADKAILFSYDLFPKFKNFLQCEVLMSSLYREIEKDENVRNLLIMYCLFSSRENLSNFEIFRYQYYSYHYLLKRYLIHKYKSHVRADMKHSLLVYLVNKYICHLKKDTATIFSKFIDIHQIGQVMTELFCQNTI